MDTRLGVYFAVIFHAEVDIGGVDKAYHRRDSN